MASVLRPAACSSPPTLRPGAQLKPAATGRGVLRGMVVFICFRGNYIGWMAHDEIALPD